LRPFAFDNPRGGAANFVINKTYAIVPPTREDWAELIKTFRLHKWEDKKVKDLFFKAARCVQRDRAGLPSKVWKKFLFDIVLVLAGSCSHCGSRVADNYDHDQWKQVVYGYIARDPQCHGYLDPSNLVNLIQQLTQYRALRPSCPGCNRGGRKKGGRELDDNNVKKRNSTNSAGLIGDDWYLREVDKLDVLAKVGCYKDERDTDGPTLEDKVRVFYFQMNFSMHWMLSADKLGLKFPKVPARTKERSYPTHAVVSGGVWGEE
jgi:hypothetical protein